MNMAQLTGAIFGIILWLGLLCSINARTTENGKTSNTSYDSSSSVMTSSTKTTVAMTTELADDITLNDEEFETTAEDDSTSGVTSSSPITSVSSTFTNLTPHNNQTSTMNTSNTETTDTSSYLLTAITLENDESQRTAVTDGEVSTSITVTDDSSPLILTTILPETLLASTTNEFEEMSTMEDITMDDVTYQTVVDNASSSSVTSPSTITSASTTTLKVVKSYKPQKIKVKSYDIETVMDISTHNLQEVVERNCKLPTMARFRRTIYRPYLGPSTSYAAESVIKSGTIIVAICKTDVIGDLITKRLVSRCRNGRWRPRLPRCIAKRRCKAPPVIENATPSESVSPYQTFPHEASITYTCDRGKMATGSRTRVCNNGRWTNLNIKCIDNPNVHQSSELLEECRNIHVMNGILSTISVTRGLYRVTCNKGYRLVPRKIHRCKGGKWLGITPKCVQVKPAVQDKPEPNDENCLNLKVMNGRISINSVTNGFDTVTCNDGYQLIPRQRFKCKGGKWTGRTPKCVREAADCKLHSSALRMSNFKSKTTGRIGRPMTIAHMTEVIQTCKRNPSKSKKVKCIDGRWRPTFMKCYSYRLYRTSVYSRRLRLTKRNKRVRQRRSVGTCIIPTLRGGPSNFTVSGDENKLQVNEPVQDGQEVQRICLEEGFMLLPGLQRRTNITSKCHLGNWTPEFPRCLRDIRDTVFYDHIEDETTTHASLSSTTTEQFTSGPISSTQTTKLTTSTVQSTSGLTTTTSVTSTTQEQRIIYKIHVSGEFPKFIFINDPSQGFVSRLDQYERSIHERNVGTITKIRVGTTNHWDDSSVNPPTGINFVSIYMKDEGDIEKFYIEKYIAGKNEIHSSPCARSFHDSPQFTPDWKQFDSNHDKDIEHENCMDLVSCKMKCIEEEAFDCKAAFYNTVKKMCVVYDKDIAIEEEKGEGLTMVKRADTCTA